MLILGSLLKVQVLTRVIFVLLSLKMQRNQILAVTRIVRRLKQLELVFLSWGGWRGLRYRIPVLRIKVDHLLSVLLK